MLQQVFLGHQRAGLKRAHRFAQLKQAAPLHPNAPPLQCSVRKLAVQLSQAKVG